MIFLVVFAIKDPLELAAEVDFDGLALEVLPIDDGLRTGTTVIKVCKVSRKRTCNFLY